MRIKSAVKLLVCGGIIGGSMLVPGVSGGTSAIILGIYDRLVEAVSDIFSDFKKNAAFLTIVAVGGVVGAVLLSGWIVYLVNLFFAPSMYLFSGAILGSVPLMVKKSRITKQNLHCLVFAAVGAAAAVGVAKIPFWGDASVDGIGMSIILQLLCGFVIAVALILPGISTSHILLVLGMYEPILMAVKQLNIVYLLPVCAGVLGGILVCTKTLDRAMKQFPSQTYMIIAGFVMASVYDIFPGTVDNALLQSVCVLLGVVGFAAVCMISLYQSKSE